MTNEHSVLAGMPGAGTTTAGAPVGANQKSGIALRQWRDADGTYHMDKQVCFDMLDCNRNLRPTEALRLFGEIANADYAERGFTHERMIVDGFYFILTHANIHLLRQPIDGELLSMQTWISLIKGMQVTRSFEVRDVQDGVLAQCEMIYLIMDANSRRPIRIKDFPLVDIQALERDLGMGKRQRIKLDEGMQEVGCVQPRFSDLDVNGHVTNTHYPGFAIDCLPAEVRERPWSRLQVEFSQQARLGEEIRLYANEAAAAMGQGDWVKVVGVLPDGATSFGCLFGFEA